MNFDQISKELKNLPDTWYPALLKIMVESAIEKKVFNIGGIHGFVEKIEHNKMMARHGHPPSNKKAEPLNINEEDLKRFDEASNHPYECKCEICKEWWANVPEEE